MNRYFTPKIKPHECVPFCPIDFYFSRFIFNIVFKLQLNYSSNLVWNDKKEQTIGVFVFNFSWITFSFVNDQNVKWFKTNCVKKLKFVKQKFIYCWAEVFDLFKKKLEGQNRFEECRSSRVEFADHCFLIYLSLRVSFIFLFHSCNILARSKEINWIKKEAKAVNCICEISSWEDIDNEKRRKYLSWWDITNANI